MRKETEHSKEWILQAIKTRENRINVINAEIEELKTHIDSAYSHEQKSYYKRLKEREQYHNNINNKINVMLASTKNMCESQYKDSKAKKECRQLANNTCEFCGATHVRVEAHHVIPAKDGGTNDLTNLVCLCKSCHEKAHNQPLFNEKLLSFITSRNLDR